MTYRPPDEWQAPTPPVTPPVVPHPPALPMGAQSYPPAARTQSPWAVPYPPPPPWGYYDAQLGGHGWGPAPTPTPKPTPLAVWSLVLALASYVVIPMVGAVAAIVTGFLARRLTGRPPAAGGAPIGGSGMATTGIVLGFFNLALVPLVVLGVRSVARSDAFEELADAFDLPPVAALEVGQCFNRFGGEGVSAAVSTVECERPHSAEVVGVIPLERSTHDVAELKVRAHEECIALFEEYTGETWEESDLLVTGIFPTAAEYRSRQHRRIVCVAEGVGYGALDGSVAEDGVSPYEERERRRDDDDGT